jgi:hypothetical protein
MKNLKFFQRSLSKPISTPFKIAMLGVSFVIFTFIACQKNVESLDVAPEGNSTVDEFRANIDPLEKLVLSPNDKAIEFINKSNIEISGVLMGLVTNSEINKFIVETAKANGGNVTYEQLFTQFPDVKPLFKNTVIGKRGILSSFTSADGEEYDFVRNNIAYKSMIFIPNASVAQASDRSIVSPELQIYRETGEGDIYFAWDVKKDKPKKEINIVEKEAMATTTPVMMTSLQHVAFLKASKITENDNPKFTTIPSDNRDRLQTRGAWDDWVYIRKANLLFNYDGGTNSELRVTAAFIANNGSAVGWSRPDKPEFEVASVGATCVANGTNGDNWLLRFSTSPSWNSRTYFFNAYEYDWGSSDKPLGKASFAGQNAFFSGRRQFTDEWYIFDPQKVQGSSTAIPLSSMFSSPGSPFFSPSDINPDGTTNNCASSNAFFTATIKAELQFTRGWY